MKVFAEIRLVVLLMLAQNAAGHGDLHEQITDVSSQILRNPRDVKLYLQRGELYRLHGEFDLALSDSFRAREMDAHAPADFLRAKVFYDQGKFTEVRTVLDKLLSAGSRHIEALLLRARALSRLKEHAAAAKDFQNAIALMATPEPDYILEHAQVLMDEERNDEAIFVLDSGMKKIGMIVSLQQCAIEIELKRQKFDAALTRIDSLSLQAPRKEPWLIWRGEILMKAGRNKEARLAFFEALVAINSLPSNRRGTQALQQLEEKAKLALERLGSNTK